MDRRRFFRTLDLIAVGLLAVLVYIAANAPSRATTRRFAPPLPISPPRPVRIAPASLNAMPIAEVMEQIQKSHAFITKAIRTPTSFRTNRAATASHARKIVRLVRSIRSRTEPAEQADLPQRTWRGHVDDLAVAAEQFAQLVDRPDTSQPEAKPAYRRVSMACTACHDDFRKQGLSVGDEVRPPSATP